jgi:hypothetical protein
MSREVRVETMYRQRATMTRSLVSAVRVTEKVENWIVSLAQIGALMHSHSC